MNIALAFFPQRASTSASEVDRLFLVLLLITGCIALLILALIVYFSLRYRRRRGQTSAPAAPARATMKLEIAWTTATFVLAMAIFAWGTDVYFHVTRSAPEAMEIDVVGKQWMWKIQHPQGAREINELHVPAGVHVRLVMTSQDVVHDFFVPAFRLHQDVLPGRYTAENFTPTQPGEYQLFCSQYCGSGHSQMIGHVIVMTPSAYADWLTQVPAAESSAAAGARLFASFGCAACHGQRAPTLAGVYGRSVVLSDGSSVVADENYLRRMILTPGQMVVKGYPSIMPAFRGQLSEEQLLDLIAYIKSLSGAAAPGAMPAPPCLVWRPRLSTTQPTRAVPGPEGQP